MLERRGFWRFRHARVRRPLTSERHVEREFRSLPEVGSIQNSKNTGHCGCTRLRYSRSTLLPKRKANYSSVLTCFSSNVSAPCLALVQGTYQALAEVYRPLGSWQERARAHGIDVFPMTKFVSMDQGSQIVRWVFVIEKASMMMHFTFKFHSLAFSSDILVVF